MGYREELGETISHARRRLNLSQGQLGKAAGVSAQQVSRWERATAIPSRAALAKVADTLGLDGRDLNDLAIEAGEEELKETKRDLASSRSDLDAVRGELESALVEVKRFVDQYQDFHASYQRIGPQVDEVLMGMTELREEIAQIKQAVLSPKNPRPR